MSHSKHKFLIPSIVFLSLWIILTPATRCGADDKSSLSQRQDGVAQRYQRLEELLLRLADVESVENPERSALLRRAARQSRDKFVLERLRGATESLRNQEFQKAVENQVSANDELAALMKLLLSEDRSNRIRDEKERYKRLIKDLKRNLNNQRSARARTENGAEFDKVEKEQKSVTQRSEELKERLAKDSEDDAFKSDQESSSPSESEKSDQQSEGSESKDGKPKDKKDDSEENSDSDSDSNKPKDPSERKPSDSEQSSQAESQQSPQGQPIQSPQGQQQDTPQQQSPQQQSPGGSPPPGPLPPQSRTPPQAQTPEQQVEQRLEQAIQKMRQAEQELKNAQREKATEKQRQAEENLRAAIDRLERILRQLREEEMQRELAKLEARLRKMAAMQTKVHEDTVELAATPKSQRSRQTDLKAGDLAFEEKKITLQADRAMLLLREEGSSVAFPEVVSQIRSDTTRVANRLAETKIDLVTQGIQKDILAALEEMIAALQKAQRDLEKKRQEQQDGQSQPAGQKEQPLVEALAELKLIRTMETRIKSTTNRYGNLLESGESSGDDVMPLLEDLSERQNRLYRITRDLVLKRNQ